MMNMIIAYALIFVVLVGYGMSLYRRARQVDESLRSLDKK
jgi:hypothetical protein